MGPRPVVAQTESGAEVVSCAQCVFTSIRSPLGRGYRIIAASSGVSADEKREIVQRAPSHGSICDASPRGRGLASFVLQSGRRCLFISQNAGAEHSARGDYRVHTHVLIMDPAAYRRLRCDPLGIAAAAHGALGHEWLNDQPPQYLPGLSLGSAAPAGGSGLADLPSASVGDVNSLAGVLSCVLESDPVLVTGLPDPLRALGWLWTGVPAAVREPLSLSCGLRFSPGRSFRLVVTAAPPNEARRIGQDHDFDVLEWASAAGSGVFELNAWLNFVRRRWSTGRAAELDELSAGLTEEAAAPDLARIAVLCDDLERLGAADLTLLEELAARQAAFVPKSPASARLHEEFRRAAAARRVQLQPAESATNDTAGTCGSPPHP